MASQHQGTSFLHLPLETRKIIYDLAFPDVVHSNLLDLAGTGYTRETVPLLYVHPYISADLAHRLYRDGFSVVLPIQEASEITRGRGLDKERLETCLDKMPMAMKQRCETLTVESAQTLEVMEEWGPEWEEQSMKEEEFEAEEADDFFEDDEFARRLVPLLIQIKAEMPALKRVKFIFWIGELAAPLHSWKGQLEQLAWQWVKMDEAQMDDNNQDTQMTGCDDPDEGAITGRLLEVEVQVNCFDYYDPDAGDGGLNWIQVWDEYAEETPIGKVPLTVDFSAMDMKWSDHLSGNYTGEVFDPQGWNNPYIHSMPDSTRKWKLHKYGFSSEEGRPLYVQTIGEGNKEKDED
ncbi:hypothetical protein ACJ41O_001388 [Fusarium nematophilum]